jgi:hypothetical protein
LSFSDFDRGIRKDVGCPIKTGTLGSKQGRHKDKRAKGIYFAGKFNANGRVSLTLALRMLKELLEAVK